MAKDDKDDVKKDDEVVGTSADADVPEESAAVAEPEAAVEPVAEVEPEAVVEEPVAEVEPEAAVEEPVAGGRAPRRRPSPRLLAEPEAAAEPEAVVEAPGTSADAGVPPAQTPSGPKPKKKRLPRSERPQRSRPKRVASTTRKPIVRLEKPEHERGRRQERQGTVVSDAMDKTIVVKVEVVKAHPKYKKVVRRSVKFHAHDERSEAKVGDVVRIVETRPISKTKHWRLAEVVEAAK